MRKRDTLLTGEKGGGDRGEAKSYNSEKAWSSTNNSMLSWEIQTLSIENV
jgi:hypothetical protein